MKRKLDCIDPEPLPPAKRLRQTIQTQFNSISLSGNIGNGDCKNDGEQKVDIQREWRDKHPVRSCRKPTNYKLLHVHGPSYRDSTSTCNDNDNNNNNQSIPTPTSTSTFSLTNNNNNDNDNIDSQISHTPEEAPPPCSMSSSFSCSPNSNNNNLIISQNISCSASSNRIMTNRSNHSQQSNQINNALKLIFGQSTSTSSHFTLHSNSKPLRIEPHPIHNDTDVIILSDDDDMNNNNNSNSTKTRIIEELSSDSSSSYSSGDSSDLSSSSITSYSSSTYYSCDPKGYLIFNDGLIILKKYKLIKQLGKGTFSRVFECHEINLKRKNKNQNNYKFTGKKYAIKIIRNVYKYQLAAQTELEVLLKIRNNDPNNRSNCIHIISDDQYRGHPIFIFPLLGRSIYSFMVNNGYKAFNNNDTIHILYQICCGVAYIHQLNIIITDLKPENIVLVNDTEKISNHGINNKYCTPISTKIKLIDFGSAVIDNNNISNNVVHKHLIQTRHYRAPEVVFKLEWSSHADIWSIGCILVELVYGKMLFNTHDSIDHLNQMVKCIDPPPSNILNKIEDDVWDDYFDNRGALNMYKAKRSPVQCKKLSQYFNNDNLLLHDLCSKMLKWDPNERISAKNALKHPVFNKYNNDSL